jgi:hypothetical protein
MISWWEADDICVEIHQSDLENDNYVIASIEDLIKIMNKLGFSVEC